MIENIPMNNKEEATDNIENNQNIEDNDHETIGRYEKTNSVSESTISKRNSVQIYLDDIVVYEDENDENKATPDNRSFINTSDILSNIMSERFIPEKPEVNITENSGNHNESNEGSRADEADSAKKGFSSDHAPRKRTASVCSDFSDIEILGIETHVTETRKEKQLDKLGSMI